jgi:alpha-tubulin suppressor-like RCC1 family protein
VADSEPGADSVTARALRVIVSLTVAILAFSIALGANGAPTPPSFTDISAGDAHACVVTGAGGVKCWGSNKFGQLGNGVPRPCNAYPRCSNPFKRTPVDVVDLGSKVKAIALGSSHSCALTSAGGVKCWGYNTSGQLGNGQICKAVKTCSKNASSTPVDVVGLTSGVSAIAAGEFHTCAVTSVGGVKCWGSQTNGELGNRTGRSSSLPVDVVGLASGVSAIAAGAHISCAITSGGTAKCWGGRGPIAVAGLPDGVTAIATGGTSSGAGSSHACALTSGGGVKCWGDNWLGQLGNGSLKNSSTPVDVVGLGSGVRAITASATHTCALTSRGGAKCWGGTILGNGSTARSSIPVDVVGLKSGVKAIAAGDAFSCALSSVGGVKCWGYNWQGRLGNGSAKMSTKPVDVRFAPRPRREALTTAPDSGTAVNGGTHARIWHWDGTRLVAGPWKQVTRGGATTFAEFFSPSRNVGCDMSDAADSYRDVFCRSERRQLSVTLSLNRPLYIGRGTSRDPCIGFPSGQGFLINSTSVRRVGP